MIDTIELEKKLRLLKDKFIHIRLNNDRFYNGTIISVGAEYMEFHDRKLGEMIIFFSEIKAVEPFQGK